MPPRSGLPGRRRHQGVHRWRAEAEQCKPAERIQRFVGLLAGRFQWCGSLQRYSDRPTRRVPHRRSTRQRSPRRVCLTHRLRRGYMPNSILTETSCPRLRLDLFSRCLGPGITIFGQENPLLPRCPSRLPAGTYRREALALGKCLCVHRELLIFA